MRFKMRQRSFQFTRWGGKRKGAGRPRKDGRSGKGVPHLPRAVLASRFPVLATWKMAEGVWNLRSRRSFRALAPALWAGAEREGFRLVHYAILGNHIHLLVEARDRTGLMRGMQGLGVRVARRLNRLMGRGGRVVGDRYHARILKTPTEVKHARRYLLTNANKHYGTDGPDDFASRVPLVVPRTWLLRIRR